MLHRLFLPALVAVFLPGVALAAPVSLKSIGDTCLESDLKDCTVKAGGYVASPDATRLAYQIQTGVDEYGGTAGGVVVFAQTDDGWSLLGSDFSGVWYQLPRLGQADEILFHIPGVTAGTGAFNADVLFQYVPEDERWIRVDMEPWWEGVEAKLPKGLGIWKGVTYDFGETYWGDLVARTSLWQDMDGNCCPTGGSAVIHLNLEDGALHLGEVDIEPPEEE